MKKKLVKLLPMLGMLAMSSAFGDGSAAGFEQGTPVGEGQLQKGYSAPARIDVQGAWDFNITGTFLYWQTLVDGLEYANYSSSATSVLGSVANPKFKWKPGCKVGLGVNFDYDDWALYTEWTHMLGRASGSASKGDLYLFPLLFNRSWEIASAVCDSSSVRSRSNFNQVDMMLYRPYYSGKSLTLVPEFGIKGIWHKMRTVNKDDNVSGYYVTNDVSHFSIAWDKTVSKYRYWAIGPEFGVKSNWLMGCGFKLFGEAKMSLAYVRARASTKLSVPVDSDIAVLFAASDGVLVNTKLHKVNLIRSIIEGNVGIGWDTYFDHSNWHFGMDFGYNFLYLPNILTVVGFQDDVEMHGGSFTLRLDF